MSFEVMTATVEDAYRLAPNMRDADVQEVAAYSGRAPLAALLHAIAISLRTWVVLIDSEPVALFGVAPYGAGIRSVWMLTSAAVERHPLAFLRRSKLWVRRLAYVFGPLANAIDARHAKALRWARWVGFTISPAMRLGVEDRYFHPIIMEVSNACSDGSGAEEAGHEDGAQGAAQQEEGRDHQGRKGPVRLRHDAENRMDSGREVT